MKNEITLSTPQDLALTTPQGNCALCGTQSKYRCPNCETLTCSFQCYKSHSQSCVENFYRAQVLDHIKSEGKIKDKEQKKLIMDAIQRTYNSQTEQEDLLKAFSEPDPSKSSNKIDIRPQPDPTLIVEELELSDEEGEEETEVVPENKMVRKGKKDKETTKEKKEKRRIQISQAEQQEFLKAVKQGKIIVPLWHPWWVPPVVEEEEMIPEEEMTSSSSPASPTPIRSVTREIRRFPPNQDEERIEQEKPLSKQKLNKSKEDEEEDRQKSEMEKAIREEKERKKQEQWITNWTLKRPSPVVVMSDDDISSSWPESKLIGEDIPLLPTDPNSGIKLPSDGLKALTPNKPSSFLQYNLVDLLYSYVLTLKLYNGDVDWALPEVIETLISHSQVLSSTFISSSLTNKKKIKNNNNNNNNKKTNLKSTSKEKFQEKKQKGFDVYPNLRSVVTFCLKIGQQSSTKEQSTQESEKDSGLYLLRDVCQCLYFKSLALRALSHIYLLVEALMKSQNSDDQTQKAARHKALIPIARKVYFYIVWLSEWSSADTVLLADALWAEYGYWKKAPRT